MKELNESLGDALMASNDAEVISLPLELTFWRGRRKQMSSASV
jgi:hypothetical protein